MCVCVCVCMYSVCFMFIYMFSGCVGACLMFHLAYFVVFSSLVKSNMSAIHLFSLNSPLPPSLPPFLRTPVPVGTAARLPTARAGVAAAAGNPSRSSSSRKKEEEGGREGGREGGKTCFYSSTTY